VSNRSPARGQLHCEVVVPEFGGQAGGVAALPAPGKWAVRRRLPITALSKWYHRRAIHSLRTVAPELDAICAIGFEPIYAGTAITRSNWHVHPEGKRRVIRESQEIPRRVAAGDIADARLIDGAWR
jgi:hypothetical protein